MIQISNSAQASGLSLKENNEPYSVSGTTENQSEPSTAPDSRDSYEKYNDGMLQRLPWKYRLKHFTWSWFTCVMACGGISNVISYGIRIISPTDGA